MSRSHAGQPAHPVPSPPSAPEPSSGQRRWVWLVASALLLAYAVMAYSATWSKGVSFDEGEQLAVGYNIWRNHDLRIEGANGDLVKRWATLPYLISQPEFIRRANPLWKNSEPYGLAHRFLFELGNRPESLLRQGRAMMVLLGLATGVLVFLGAREIFGPLGGLVSLATFVFNPAMLAFGAIVSTDMTITLTLFGTTWCVWRLLHEVTWGRLLASLVFTGLMVLAKMSSLTIFPITAGLLLVRFIDGRPLLLRWRNRTHAVVARGSQATVVAGLVILHALAAWGTIWAHYEFRYAASPDPSDPALVFRGQPYRDRVPGVLATVITWSRQAHFFPEGFRKGVNRLLGNDDHLGAFMNGRWRAGGWRSFFPYTIWAKTQPAFFGLLILGAGTWGWARWRHRPSPPASGPPGEPPAPSLYAAVPHVMLIVGYLGIAMTEDINLGHRHVLPIYPGLHVLAGAVAIGWTRRAIWRGVAVALSLGWLAADSLAVRPHYLAYFGPQVGGPAKGYLHLVDSSLDWGMDLPGLKTWLDQNNPRHEKRVYLAYFGTDEPLHYQLGAQGLPGFFDWHKRSPYALEPGLYAISASLLQGVYTKAFGPWNKDFEQRYQSVLNNVRIFDSTAKDFAARAKLIQQQSAPFWEAQFALFDHLRFARLCAWLRHHGPPLHQVGYSILIWDLDAQSIADAIYGPTVELYDAPAGSEHKQPEESPSP